MTTIEARVTRTAVPAGWSSRASVAPPLGTSTPTVVAVVVIAVGVLAGAGALAVGAAFPAVAAITIAARAAIADARTGRLPNRWVLLAGAAALAGSGAGTVTGSGTAPAVGAVLGALAFGGPVLVVHLVAPTALGFGDVKLAVVLGLALGPIDPALGMLGLGAASGLTAAAAIASRRRALPFGPGLVLGAALSLAWWWCA